MTPFTALLALCAASALAALLLSGTRLHRSAARLARVSLWSLCAAPIVIALGVAADPAPEDASSKAYVIARVISAAMNYAAALVPTALMASIALRRARAARSR